MNITDVDDKTIRDSQKEGVSLKEFTARYEKAFFEDLNTLNILPSDVFPRATDYIDEMVEITKSLLKKSIAYKGEDGSIYYNIHKFKDYGRLANIDISKLQAGASGRVKKDEYEKDDVQDFALWKAWVPEDGNNYWEPIIEVDVTDEEYKNIIEQAIRNNDKEFLELNRIRTKKAKNGQFP